MSELDEIRVARLALSWLAEPGNRALCRRVADLGPVLVLDELLRNGRAARTRQAVGADLDEADPRRLAEAALARAQRLDARVVIPEDDEWPASLNDLWRIGDESAKDPVDRDTAPPLCVWVRGGWRLDEALDRSVAVVGARAATSYGTQVAREIGYGLASRDWTVVSGGAYGIDGFAHRGALAAGGITVAVLACGVDRPYPASHASLFDRIAEDGLLISEWPLGADPFRHRFLIRNRVIAAITKGTVVVEAGPRSGSLQTLRRAGQLHRHRMVVPGPVTSAMSVGCHEQLRNRDEHTTLVTGVPHIVELVGAIGHDLAPVPRGPEHPRDGLAATERRLLEALLKRKPLSSEEVAVRARVPVSDAMRILPELVVRGFAKRREHGFILALHTDATTRSASG
ncbi:MAG TPA: DNA-processing protein DprA [Natronosporangium sp.]